MAFNVIKMYEHCCNLIDEFYKEHSAETFYGFAIQAGGLHLNSLEKLDKIIQYYRKKYPDHYNNDESINSLKWDVGGWAYKHFIELAKINGYDQELFYVYYDLCFDNNDPEVAKSTEYYKAMEELFNLLIKSDSLAKLRKSPDFDSFFIAADD